MFPLYYDEVIEVEDKYIVIDANRKSGVLTDQDITEFDKLKEKEKKELLEGFREQVLKSRNQKKLLR